MSKYARDYRVGVDEAGRGSLVGEMIVGVVAVPSSMIDLLRDSRVRDSKELSPSMRRKIYDVFKNEVVFSVVPVSPEVIDEENLGKATLEAICKGLETISKRINPLHVYSITIDRFGKERDLRARVRRLGYRNAVVRVEEKADKKYPEVSLASIFAKHVRDRRIAVINSITGLRGSGYPSDEETVNSVFSLIRRGGLKGYRRYIRLSWSTLERLGVGSKAKRRVKRKTGKTLEDFL